MHIPTLLPLLFATALAATNSTASATAPYATASTSALPSGTGSSVSGTGAVTKPTDAVPFDGAGAQLSGMGRGSLVGLVVAGGVAMVL